MVVGALVGGAVVARQVWLDDRARAVDAEEALDRFRAASTGSAATSGPAATGPDDPVGTTGATGTTDTMAAPEPTLPDPGVYRYATTGSEAIDVLGGAEHPYPPETTVTVTPDGCGVLLRWDLLVERREEWRLCAAEDGVVLQTTGAFYHEFFAHGSLEAMECNRPVLLVPVDGLPRPPVPQRCTLNGREWLPAWEVIGTDVRSVDGSPLGVTHVRMTVVDDDEHYEHVVADWWLDAHGLPVSMSATKTSRSTSGLVGDVVYDEQYTAQLTSLTPLR